MATRATRSASSASSNHDDPPPRHLLELSHDELGVIVDGLADPLQPVVAVSLSSTCKGLRTPMQAALEVLKEWHRNVKELCRTGSLRCKPPELGHPSLGISFTQLRDAGHLSWPRGALHGPGTAALGMILRTQGLPMLDSLWLGSTCIDDTGMQGLFQGLGRGAAPSLRNLHLGSNKFGLAGAEALAAALCRDAMPKLGWLHLGGNSIGSQGLTVLAASLRKMPALHWLEVSNCGTGDEGVVSLFSNLGKDDFKELKVIFIDGNKFGDDGCAALVSALDKGAMLKLRLISLGHVSLLSNSLGDEAHAALVQAAARRDIRL